MGERGVLPPNVMQNTRVGLGDAAAEVESLIASCTPRLHSNLGHPRGLRPRRSPNNKSPAGLVTGSGSCGGVT